MNLNDVFDEDINILAEKARAVQREIFGNKVYVRGLIEMTNHCRNDCYYCGIRSSNNNIGRYRLNESEILDSCARGYKRGFRTFVLQGGEDPYFHKEKITALICSIKNTYPDCAITLSLGEYPETTYRAWFDAGADRYLLRHETATDDHYSSLHPDDMSLKNRIDCLHSLKKIGYQTGCGFMVGSPGQTREHILNDLRFIYDFKPHMVGIGPFIPHADTKYRKMAHGDTELTLRLISALRILLPNAMIPATTALASIDPMGREKGILAGANVLMPNISPIDAREKYNIYNNKTKDSEDMKKKMDNIGYELTKDRGDYKCMM